MKIKMFSRIIVPSFSWSSHSRKPLDDGLEEEMNEWLAQNPSTKIHQLEQTMCGGSWASGKLLVSVLYEG